VLKECRIAWPINLPKSLVLQLFLLLLGLGDGALSNLSFVRSVLVLGVREGFAEVLYRTAGC
jgi:hypothetical protein